jgi:hypothetical protein
MSDERHKSELCDLFNDIISNIDKLPLHPRNKILLYSRYLLSKMPWNLTITYISKSWICETLDNVATKYIFENAWNFLSSDRPPSGGGSN